MYTNHINTESRDPSCNQVLGTRHPPDTKSSLVKKHVQLAVLIRCRGGPLSLQVLDVNCARGPGQHQGHKATTDLLGIPHDGHGHKPVWRDGLLSHRTQVILKKVPDIDPGRIILDQEHSRPGRGPLQASDRVATGAAVPLHERPLGRQLVQSDASI